MKTDTLIGIIGSVLLVGIIISVFVYEYNNVETVNDDQMRRDFFTGSPKYGHLDPDQDIDGDGIPNYKDFNLDNDGLENADDDEIAVTMPFDGQFTATTIAPGGSSTVGTYSTEAMKGVTSIQVTVTVTPTGALLPTEAFTTSVFINEVLQDSGDGPFSVNGQVGTVQIDIDADALTLGGSYTGSIKLIY